MIALIAARPRIALVVMAYSYIAWSVASFLILRLRRKQPVPAVEKTTGDQQFRRTGDV
jgi:hypothetical protein